MRLNGYGPTRHHNRGRAASAARDAAAARLSRRRSDRARSGDRLRRYRIGRRSAGRLDRRAGRRALPACRGATTMRCSATPSARIRGSSSCIRRVLRLWQASATKAGRSIVRGPPNPRSASPSSACAPASCTRSPSRIACSSAGPIRRSRTTRRGAKGAFIVAVNCGQAGGTCFCVSMNTGPKADAGFDLALTELLGGEHVFLVEVGSEARRGAARTAAASRRPTPKHSARPPTRSSRAPPQAWAGRCASDDVHELLLANLEHPRWDDVAERCLTCGNCTMVCPTCFCTSVEDASDLAGQRDGSARGAGIPASPWTSPTSTAAACAPRAQVALPPVDDAQARDLDRPVRHVGLRRLRPLHHLVSGRHRHHRGGARHPRRATCAEGGDMMKGLSASSREHPFVRGARRGVHRSWSPAAPGTCASMPGSICSARATRRTSSI